MLFECLHEHGYRCDCWGTFLLLSLIYGHGKLEFGDVVGVLRCFGC